MLELVAMNLIHFLTAPVLTTPFLAVVTGLSDTLFFFRVATAGIKYLPLRLWTYSLSAPHSGNQIIYNIVYGITQNKFFIF